jgi:hypothetical protein
MISHADHEQGASLLGGVQRRNGNQRELEYQQDASSAQGQTFPPVGVSHRPGD